jgi:hypothetical protein
VAISVVELFPAWLPGYEPVFQLALLVQKLLPPAPVHVALAAFAFSGKIPPSDRHKAASPQTNGRRAAKMLSNLTDMDL